MQTQQWVEGNFLITTDPHRVDVEVVYEFLSKQTYWARDIPRAVLEKSVRNALCFSIWSTAEDAAAQVGFARVISDFATTAYIGDVFVLPSFRGRGLSKWLMSCILAHPELQGLRRWILVTSDAHGLYSQFGFKPLARAQTYMERHDPQVYARAVL